MSFMQDTLKGVAIVQRHAISFEEAQSVFRDPLAVTLDDQRHSD